MLFLQVVGSQHFHLLAFHVIQGNQVIVRGVKRKTVESVLNCLKASCIALPDYFGPCVSWSVRSCFVFVVCCCSSPSQCISIWTSLIEGTGYEARQTSKEQTKMPRFRLEGPRPCKIFCFAALIHYA